MARVQRGGGEAAPPPPFTPAGPRAHPGGETAPPPRCPPAAAPFRTAPHPQLRIPPPVAQAPILPRGATATGQQYSRGVAI